MSRVVWEISPEVRAPGGSGCGIPGVSDLGKNLWEMAKFGGFHGGNGED